MTAQIRSLEIAGPAGRLEALLSTPEGGDPIATAILCHAHPLHGGQMRYKLLYRVSKLMRQVGFAVLRFNFRGVGLSEGVHDHGIGEQDDLRAARRELDRLFPGKPMVLGGFSFGSVVSSRVAVDAPRVSSLLLLGYPLARVTSKSYLEGEAGAGISKLFVVGERDQYCPVAEMERWIPRVSEPRRLEIVRDADHFFTGRHDALGDVIEHWLDDAETPAGER